MLVVAAVVVVAVLSSRHGDDGPAGGGWAADTAVPAVYRPWITRAGSRCTDITPALLAAQLRQESGFDPRAVSSVGARGIAQFMPGTWETWATDGDGDGIADVWNPADAIAAQGRFMCALAAQARRGREAGRLHGDVVQLALAGYNAGFGAVWAAGGVPAFPETTTYVRSITAMVATATRPATVSARPAAVTLVDLIGEPS